ncbi:MAG: hypothetical protein EOP51_00010 [Sphingobacteriales bacterium]|nr:MAG: hypothetical protein EOP51_00010 [Sphingobacteriales bacterium]
MNPRYLLLILLLACVLPCTAKEPKKVKKRVEIQYVHKWRKDKKAQSKWRNVKTLKGYERYDTSGLVVEEGRYGKLILVLDKVTREVLNRYQDYKQLDKASYYVYNDTGKRIRTEYWQYANNKKGYRFGETIYDYDAAGKLKAERFYAIDDSIPISKYYNHLPGNRVAISDTQFYSATISGLPAIFSIQYDTTSFDSAGRKIGYISYSWYDVGNETELLYRDEFQYRGKYLLTRLSYSGNSQSLSHITRWNYKAGRLAREIWLGIYSEDNTDRVYVYNKRGLLKKMKYYRSSKYVSTTKYKYQYY